MLTYNFENIGSDSLYEFLYKCIKNDIIQGIILSGEKLPSKRALAKNLAISVITVENAYGQLLAEGYIYSIPKSGYYVSDLSGIPVHQTEYTSETYEAEEQGTDSRTAKAGDKVLLTGGENAFIADFTSNQTEHAAFPFSIWNKTMRAVMNDYQEEMMINPPCGGVMELRKSISSYLKEFCAMYVRPEQIIIGVNYEYIDLDEEGTSAKKLEEKKVDIMHISPSHHFPTGMVMPISKRYELLGWVTREKERYIIEDDYDSELRLAGKPIPSLQSIDVSGKVIYINTFAKTLCSTVRISYMVLPEALAEKYYRELSFYSCTVSNFEQYTLAAFMNAGAFEKHINRLRNYYQHKRDLILSTFLREPLGKYITISEEDSGVHFLMHVNTSMSEQEFLLKTRAKGIRLATLSSFYNAEQKDSRYENTYVMNYSFVNCDRLEYVAQTLYKIIHP